MAAGHEGRSAAGRRRSWRQIRGSQDSQLLPVNLFFPLKFLSLESRVALLSVGLALLQSEADSPAFHLLFFPTPGLEISLEKHPEVQA